MEVVHIQFTYHTNCLRSTFSDQVCIFMSKSLPKNKIDTLPGLIHVLIYIYIYILIYVVTAQAKLSDITTQVS